MRQRVVIAVGLPASGKSTWFTEQGITPLSSDHLRGLLSDDVDNQQVHDEVFEAVRTLLDLRLRIGQPVSYVDATHLKRVFREPYFEIAGRYDADVEAFWFDAPLEVCLERNRGRARQVPEEVMTRMGEELEAPTEAEGFSQVTRIGVDS